MRNCLAWATMSSKERHTLQKLVVATRFVLLASSKTKGFILYLPPARPKDSSGIANGSQWLMRNLIQKHVSPGQAIAMIGQARYLEMKQPSSSMNVLFFK